MKSAKSVVSTAFSEVKIPRKIFALSPDCHVSSGYYRFLWRRHIYDALRPLTEILITPEGMNFDWARQGHDVDTGPLDEPRATSSERLWKMISEAHQQHGLDAVISYCFAWDVDPELVKRTIQRGIPWINFFCDSTHMFEKVEPLARVVSLNWFPESAAAGRYAALGVPSLCAPYAMNPECLPDLGCRTPEVPMAFVGLPSSNRITQLGWLRLFGCRVTIRGRSWVANDGPDPFHSAKPRSERIWQALFKRGLVEKALRRVFWQFVRAQTGGALSDEEFGPFIQRCGVVLGLNQGKDEQGRFMSYMKFRDVEFPGYGCCYLTEHNEDVPRAFEVGKEILTYRTMWEAADNTRRMLREPERARLIGQAGRARVMRSHTWATRLGELAAKL